MGTLIKKIAISIAWGILFLVAYTIYEIGLPNSFSELLGHLALFIFFLAFYLGVSILGWVFFGLPIHWVIMKYSSSEFIYYPIAGLGFFFLILILSNLEIALLIGGAAILQASVFATLIEKEE